MSDLSSEAWFFSQNGERLGPVTWADLQAKAQAGTLDPRLDLVWCSGMSDWKPSGEVEGLFERRSTELPTTLTEGPGVATVQTPMGSPNNWPGMRRRGFLFLLFLFPAIFQFALLLVTPLLMNQLGYQISQSIVAIAPIVVVIVAIYAGLSRLLNLGMSRWWYLANFVPILNLWVGYRCFACPAGYAVHKKLDGIGILLAIIYWLMMLALAALVVGIVIVVVMSLQNPDSVPPEFRDLLDELIREAAAATT